MGIQVPESRISCPSLGIQVPVDLKRCRINSKKLA
jgi:hypothetical protein